MNNPFEKLNVSIEKTKAALESGSGGKKQDKRFLNYYDMKPGKDTIVVRFLPVSEDGELFYKYSIHKDPNFKEGNISCAYTSSKERCPACSRSYEAYQAGDKKTQREWNSQDRVIGQVVVVHSDIEINEADDGNMVKLMYVPRAIVKEVMKSIDNGLVTDVTNTNFFIKKTMKTSDKGKDYAEYDSSFFNPNSDYEVPQEFIDSFNAGKSYLYDIEKDVAPAPATAAEVQEWMDKIDNATKANDTQTSAVPDVGAIVEQMRSGTVNVQTQTTTTVSDNVAAPQEADAADTAVVSSADDLLSLLNNRG